MGGGTQYNQRVQEGIPGHWKGFKGKTLDLHAPPAGGSLLTPKAWTALGPTVPGPQGSMLSVLAALPHPCSPYEPRSPCFPQSPSPNAPCPSHFGPWDQSQLTLRSQSDASTF